MGQPSIYDVIHAYKEHNRDGAKAGKRKGSSVSYSGPIF